MTAGAKTRRVKRVGELIRRELGRILLAEVSDPRIGFVTLTRVDVSADLQAARVFVSMMGTPAQQRSTLRGLNSARQRIQAEVGQCLSLRRVPDISFHEDDGVKRSIRIGGLLSSLARERAESESVTTPQSPAENGLQETTDNDVSG